MCTAWRSVLLPRPCPTASPCSRPSDFTSSTVSAAVTTDVSDLAAGLRARSVPPAVYLSLLLVSPVLYQFGIVSTTTAGSRLPGRGPVLLLVAELAALVAWLLTHRDREWDLLTKAWFASVLLLWIYLVVVEATGGDLTNRDALIIPITVIMLWIKPPGRRDTWVAADVFAWSIVVASAVALALEAHGRHSLLVSDHRRLLRRPRRIRPWLPLVDAGRSSRVGRTMGRDHGRPERV